MSSDQVRGGDVASFQPIFGHCECGTVRFKVNQPSAEVYHCHCTRCRRLHGTLFATYAFMMREHIEIEQGEENLSTYRSPNACWHFCRTCGCHLFAESDRKPGVMWYKPAVLEQDAHPGHPKKSEKHIFVSSKAPLETISDGLPQYEGYAPADVSPTA